MTPKLVHGITLAAAIAICLFPPWVEQIEIQNYGGMVIHGPGLAPTVGPIGQAVETATVVYGWAFQPPAPANAQRITLAPDFNPPKGYPMFLQLVGWPPYAYMEAIGVRQVTHY